MTNKELLQFTRQIGTLINAGISLPNALGLITQSANTRQKTWLDLVINNLNRGVSFAKSLELSEKTFSPYYCGLIHMGETTGRLGMVLEQLGNGISHQIKVEDKLSRALTYPIAVITIAIAILAGLLIWIIPTFEQVFSQLQAELPTPTRILLSGSRYVRSYLEHALCLVALLILISIFSWQRSIKIQIYGDLVLLKMPIYKKIMRAKCMSRWSSMMYNLHAGGIPLLEAVRLSGYCLNHWVVHEISAKVHHHLTYGHSIYASLLIADPKHHIFDPMSLQMIQLGEASGNLGSMLSYLTTHHEDALDQTIGRMTELLEPILISVMGLFIGSMIIALYLPLFKMGEIT